MRSIPRQVLAFAIISTLIAFSLVYGLVQQPGFTDAFYHINAANRLVSGQGLTDAYLWTYIGAPDSLPAPSHLYWMPMTSFTAAVGMALFNAPGDYQAAQFLLAVMLAAGGGFAFWLGLRCGKSYRHAWTAGIMTVTGGFFSRFWGATDTFTPYLFFGGLCLGWMGLAMTSEKRRWLFWLLAGGFAAAGHLTRADGLLLLLVGWAVILYPFDWLRGFKTQGFISTRLAWLLIFTAGYLLLMAPWFLRNLDAIGTPLPVGGTQSIWFTQYDDLFNYPPDASPQTLFAGGTTAFFETRWLGLRENFGTFIAIEGFVVLMPLMLIGLWAQRKEQFWRAFWIYALGLHLAMTFVFPFPGYRGGLFHSAAALLPFWSVLAVLGLDAVVDWIARRRRRWQPKTAKAVFTAGIWLLVLWLSWSVSSGRRVLEGTPVLYNRLRETLPANSRIMINDPAQLYYFSGLGGVVLPNESVEIIPAIAAQYQIDYLLVEGVTPDGDILAAPAPLQFNPDAPPPFLIPLPPFETGNTRLYAITHDEEP